MDNKRTIFNSYADFNNLPIDAQDIIDIPNVNTFANIIDTEKTVITKGVFPGVNTGEIEPIQIKLVLKPGRFVKIGGSLASELPVINILNLPNAEAKPYNFNGTAITQIDKFIKKVQDSIRTLNTLEEKRATYNSYANFDALPTEAKKLINNLMVRGVVITDRDILLSEILESKIISIGTFPSAAGETIPKITLELKLNKSSKFLYKFTDYYKRIQINIDFKGILS